MSNSKSIMIINFYSRFVVHSGVFFKGFVEGILWRKLKHDQAHVSMLIKHGHTFVVVGYPKTTEEISTTLS